MEGMIRASMGLATNVMTGARDTAIGLSHELDQQKGMAGDDDAGRDFAKVYKSRTVLRSTWDSARSCPRW